MQMALVCTSRQKALSLFNTAKDVKGKHNALVLAGIQRLRIKDGRAITAHLHVMYDSGKDTRIFFDTESGDNSMTVADCVDYWRDKYVKVALRPKTRALCK
ncbi:hypothetical protein MKZ79_01380 [Erwinia sp. CGal63]